jgi:3-oxoadipate enol-lactonase
MDFNLSKHAIGEAMKINTSDGIIGTTITGTGRPIILFHSLLADRGSFDRIVPSLAKQLRVIVMDLPGFGESSSLEGGLVDIADRMAQAVRHVSEAEKPIILGNGFGGFIALQMAIRHPDCLDRLILADSGATFSEAGRQAFRNMAKAASAKGLEAIADTAMLRLFAPEFQAENPIMMTERRAAFLRTDPDIFQIACAALAELDLREDARHMEIPTLVMVGEHDEATPPPMSIELASLLPNARLVILSGCAHVPQLQKPDVFLAEIADFISDPI